MRQIEDEKRELNRQNEQRIMLADLDKIEREYHRFRENSCRALSETADASNS